MIATVVLSFVAAAFAADCPKIYANADCTGEPNACPTPVPVAMTVTPVAPVKPIGFCNGKTTIMNSTMYWTSMTEGQCYATGPKSSMEGSACNEDSFTAPSAEIEKAILAAPIWTTCGIDNKPAVNGFTMSTIDADFDDSTVSCTDTTATIAPKDKKALAATATKVAVTATKVAVTVTKVAVTTTKVAVTTTKVAATTTKVAVTATPGPGDHYELNKCSKVTLKGGIPMTLAFVGCGMTSGGSTTTHAGSTSTPAGSTSHVLMYVLIGAGVLALIAVIGGGAFFFLSKKGE